MAVCKVEDYALGTMISSYELGSTVKGATVLAGYQTEAIKPYTHFYRCTNVILKELEAEEIVERLWRY